MKTKLLPVTPPSVTLASLDMCSASTPQPLRTPTHTHPEGPGLGYITPLLHSAPANEIQGQSDVSAIMHRTLGDMNEVGTSIPQVSFENYSRTFSGKTKAQTEYRTTGDAGNSGSNLGAAKRGRGMRGEEPALRRTRPHPTARKGRVHRGGRFS